MGYKICIGYCSLLHLTWHKVVNVCCFPKSEYIAYCLIKLSKSCIKWFKMEVMVWNQCQKLSMIIIPTLIITIYPFSFSFCLVFLFPPPYSHTYYVLMCLLEVAFGHCFTTCLFQTCAHVFGALLPSCF